MASAAVSFQKKIGHFYFANQAYKETLSANRQLNKSASNPQASGTPFRAAMGPGLLFMFNNCAGLGWLKIKDRLNLEECYIARRSFSAIKILSKKNIEMCFRCKSIFDAVGEFCYQIIFGFKI